jgi:transcriptional regulator with XRE-family HTH domain
MANNPRNPRPEAVNNYLKSEAITQAGFADRLGVKQSTVSKWCAGDKRPGLDMAVKIEAATGGAVPVDSWVRHSVSSSAISVGHTPGGVQPAITQRGKCATADGASQ